MVLTYRYYIEPENLVAESGVKPISIPMQPTVETVLEVLDTTTPEELERLDAAMQTRGYARVVP